ncbi:hypothetical protein TCA2_3419 [Paenibacillus sp. TCA20]|uniref:Uncharacterized protein n=1 Tax=Paenibacillus urinalis TaxID=521520 RepID=A0ABY7XCT9_9BACL|nr:MULTISPECIES: hypothetical protein [Paenibacillus]WDI03602.1 hypothetical protein PUW25_06495 [Paenibacillus urinalis]GAK40928.1 hypothetical protein TCA2_3419 [Paenibacillus sp. TCA20]
MWKVSVALISCIFIFALSAFLIESMEEEIKPDDVHVEAVLKIKSNSKMDHKVVMLEVLIDKNKYTQHMIYPYIPGLHSMSFDNNEENGYFVPTSIGVGPGDEQKVYDTLINQKIINSTIEKEQLGLIGFWSPQEAGVHKMRIYFRTAEDFNANNEMYLIYVHKAKGLFGQDIGWTKLIRVKSNL